MRRIKYPPVAFTERRKWKKIEKSDEDKPSAWTRIRSDRETIRLEVNKEVLHKLHCLYLTAKAFTPGFNGIDI